MGIADSEGAAFAAGGSQTLAADSINRVVLRDEGGALTVSAPVQIACGLRNAAGRKSEWAEELAVAPASFPAEFTGGLFVPFSGVFNQGGPANDENPVVFVDLQSGSLFHFIDNGVMGHPNGVLATQAGLFLTDLNPGGRFGDPIGTGGAVLTLNGVEADLGGVVYLITSTDTAVPEPSTSGMADMALAWGGVAIVRRKLVRQP